jgi:hypothetical protein
MTDNSKNIPHNFQLSHITSDPVTESEIQIRYNNGNIEHISKEEVFERLIKENLEDIMKISWDYDNKRMRCAIIKGEDIPSFVIDYFNFIINPNDYYCMITNFSYNPYTTSKSEGKAYYNISDDYAIEVWYVYRIEKNQTIIEI